MVICRILKVSQICLWLMGLDKEIIYRPGIPFSGHGKKRDALRQNIQNFVLALYGGVLTVAVLVL